MEYTPKILAFAGSTGTASFNKKLVRVAVCGARAVGAQVTLLDLRDFPMPLYDSDLEAREGLPENARRFKDFMLCHDGLLISSPEYNSGISGVLKNTIDWASRLSAGESSPKCFLDKVAVLMSASPGKLGGLRGLVQVRSILENMDVLVLPQQIAVSGAQEAFSAAGTLTDLFLQKAVEKLGEDLAQMLRKLKGPRELTCDLDRADDDGFALAERTPGNDTSK